MRNSRLENKILQQVDELIQKALSVSLKDEPGREEQLASCVALVHEMGDSLMEILEGQEQHLRALLEQLISQRLPDRRILQSFGNFAEDINYVITEGVASYLKSLDNKVAEEKQSKQAAASASLEDDLYDDSEDLEQVASEDIIAAEATLSTTVPETTTSPPAEQKYISLQEQREELETAAAGDAAAPGDVPEPLSISSPEIPAVPEVDTAQVTEPEAETEDRAVGTSEADNGKLENLRLALLQAYPGEELIADYPTPYGNIAFFLPRLQLGFQLAESCQDWRYDFFCRRKGICLRLITAGELVNPIFLARRLRREALWQQRP